ncbi:MAG: U32 family peptidase, partial [Erysipelotrichaceae bacterium]
MKIELLAPAGSFEAAKAAINNGCSAIYLAGQLYGARESATNFNNEQMHEVIDYAHLSNIKVFVTMNTLILDDEMKDALEYVKFLYEAGVDAILIQDLGLMQLIKNNFPDLPLHASTQMHIHNLAGVKMCKTLGFTRVVLARETPIEIIKQATKLGIEIEVFVHGANCISYSGQCLFSSMQGGRSGNRGACAQPCRLPYTLHDSTHKFKTNGDYLLSPKDNYNLNNLKEIIDSGVTSLKIEGRLKRSEYVAQVVSSYANAINNIESNKPNIINETTNIEFKKIFNRGFSEGHMFNNYGKALMNYKRPNHQGIPIGKVKCIRNHKVYITLSDNLKQGDGIRILNSKADVGFNVNKLYLNDLLVNSAKANDTIALEVKELVATNDLVVKTSDITQLKELASTYIDCITKTPINIKLSIKVGEPIKIILNDNINTIECKSEYIVEEAKTTSIKERLIEQVNKIKDQPFYYEEAIYDIDEKGYVPIKVINELRRTAI